MQFLLLFILLEFISFGQMPLNDPCLNYKTKTYQILTSGVDKSKVDSIIANSKVEPKGFRTYENGKLISAIYPPNKQYWQYGTLQRQEQYLRNEKGDVLLEIINEGGQIDTTFYEYNENGKISEIRKNTIVWDKPTRFVYKYNYAKDTVYEKLFNNQKHTLTVAIWEQQEKPKINVHQSIYPEKSNIINKFVWDEHLNNTEMIQCESDSCYTTLKIDFTYDDCGRVIRKTASYDPDKNTIWSIEWNEIIE